MAELTLRHTKRVVTASLLLAGAFVGSTNAAQPAVASAYPQTQHAAANLALLVEPIGWQEPVVTASAEVPLDSAEAAAVTNGSPSSFPLEPYAESGVSGGESCDGCAAGGTNGSYTRDTYINGTFYDPSCAPHDPLQPRCRYTDDFMWGCGGSPFRHGPGKCDTWRVGPVWDVAVDGVVLHREDANLAAIIAATDDGGALIPEFTDQFEYGPGGRLSITGKVPRWVGYRVHAGYLGVPEWNSSIVYPTIPDPLLGPLDPGSTITRRQVNYQSSLHAAELNFLRCYETSDWQPYFGVRYLRIDDQLRDFTNQEALPPAPSDMPLSVETTDYLNMSDLQNSLIGFQIGVRRDVWRIGRRFALQGFVNGGVYHNNAKRTSFASTTFVEQFADDTDIAGDQGRVDISQANSTQVNEISDIAYVGEASLTAVCKLNRCCALRGGYQVLWIDGLRLAEDAFLTGDDISRDMLFYGWHAGFEYRR